MKKFGFVMLVILMLAGCASNRVGFLGYLSDPDGTQHRFYGVNFGSNTSAVGTQMVQHTVTPLGKGTVTAHAGGTHSGVLPNVFYGAVAGGLIGAGTGAGLAVQGAANVTANAAANASASQRQGQLQMQGQWQGQGQAIIIRPGRPGCH